MSEFELGDRVEIKGHVGTFVVAAKYGSSLIVAPLGQGGDQIPVPAGDARPASHATGPDSGASPASGATVTNL